MRRFSLKQVVESISFDILQMHDNGVAKKDIANYLERKAKEIRSDYVR